MPTIPIDKTGRTWTYGCEHEFADWDTRKGWDGFGRDPEPNIVNTNGIAADPSLKSYWQGGEINSPPTTTAEGQAELLQQFLKIHPDSVANWRCGLHVHIRVPGLSSSLNHLKRISRYIHDNTDVYDLVDPLPLPGPEHKTCYKQAKHRYNWMRMSHFTKIGERRVERQEKSTSLTQFFDLEVPISKAGKPLWHAQPRAGVNLRQLKQTDTIEFRHFPATRDPQEVVTSVEWCRDYLLAAFDGFPAVELFQSRYREKKFPTLDTIYDHWQEQRWLRTTITKNKREVINKNIQEILEEDRKTKRREIDCY